MSSPLVTIVLPVYNGSHYLGESIQSCLAQTYGDWELVIVDDASTDDTPARIADYIRRDKRIRSIRQEINRKLPAALNTGFRNSRGAYLTWISDDNAFRPEAIAEMVRFLERRPDVDLVYADYTQIDENGVPLRRVAVETPQGLPLNNWVGACFLYRRAVHERLGGYAENLFLAEDYDFWLRAAAHLKLEPVHEDLYLYRIHNASLTSQKAEAIRVARLSAIRRNLPGMHWLNHQQRAAYFLECANDARNRQDFPAARADLYRALLHSPREVLRRRSVQWIFCTVLGPHLTELLTGSVKRSG